MTTQNSTFSEKLILVANVTEEACQRRQDLVELYFRRVKEQIVPVHELLKPEGVTFVEIAGTVFGNLTVAVNESVSFIAEVVSEEGNDSPTLPASLVGFLSTTCKLEPEIMAGHFRDLLGYALNTCSVPIEGYKARDLRSENTELMESLLNCKLPGVRDFYWAILNLQKDEHLATMSDVKAIALFTLLLTAGDHRKATAFRSPKKSISSQVELLAIFARKVDTYTVERSKGIITRAVDRIVEAHVSFNVTESELLNMIAEEKQAVDVMKEIVGMVCNDIWRSYTHHGADLTLARVYQLVHNGLSHGIILPGYQFSDPSSTWEYSRITPYNSNPFAKLLTRRIVKTLIKLVVGMRFTMGEEFVYRKTETKEQTMEKHIVAPIAPEKENTTRKEEVGTPIKGVRCAQTKTMREVVLYEFYKALSCLSGKQEYVYLFESALYMSRLRDTKSLFDHVSNIRDVERILEMAEAPVVKSMVAKMRTVVSDALCSTRLTLDKQITHLGVKTTSLIQGQCDTSGALVSGYVEYMAHTFGKAFTLKPGFIVHCENDVETAVELFKGVEGILEEAIQELFMEFAQLEVDKTNTPEAGTNTDTNEGICSKDKAMAQANETMDQVEDTLKELTRALRNNHDAVMKLFQSL